MRPGGRFADRAADAYRAYRELATAVRLFVPATDRTAKAKALADVHRAIRRGAVDRRRQFENPSHRPDERTFREACRAAAKRHHVSIPTVTRIIVTRIAPTLPERHRVDLLGAWPTIDEQVKYLTLRLYRKR